MLNFCRVRMVGAFKLHIIPLKKQSCLLKQLRNNIFESVKNILLYVNYLKSYELFRVPRDEEMISPAMESCIVTEHLLEQGALISHDVVNRVQGLGFTPPEEFLPGSAPTVASSAPRIHPGPDISRRTLSAIKDQIRIHRGRARELRRQAVEKEEDARRNGNEEWRLFYQASELDEKGGLS